MKLRSRSLLSTLVLTAALGCGGASRYRATEPKSVGAIVALSWPARLREIAGPSAATAATITLHAASGDLVPALVRRPSGAGAATTTTTLPQAVKPGIYLLTVDFLADAQSTYSPLATAAINVRVLDDGTIARTDGTALGTITAASNVASVALVSGQSVEVGATVDLGVTALAPDNSVVALTPGSVGFALASGGESLRLNGDETVTGLAEGTATLVPTVDGLSGAAVAVTVAPAPLAARAVDAPNAAYVYDPTRRLFWLAVPATAAGGNSIRSLDPATGTLGTPLFVGSGPSVLALSDDGSTLYAGLSGAGAVRRIDLGTMTAGPQFPLSSPIAGVPVYALDIAVQPGHPRTVALTLQDASDSGNTGPTVYDDGVARPNSLSIYQGTSLEWTAPDRIVAYDGSDTGADLLEALVDANGATLGRDVRNGLSAFAGDFVLAGGRVYDTGGLVVDATTFAGVGAFPLSTGTVPIGQLVGPAVDVAANRAYFVQYDNGGTVRLRAFRLDTFVETGSRRLANVTVAATLGRALDVHVFRWGATGLAFNSGDRVYLIDDVSGL